MSEIINGILSELSFFDGFITPKMELSNDLGIDSLRMVELIVALEEHFNITISESDLDPDSLTIVGDIYNLIDKYIM